MCIRDSFNTIQLYRHDRLAFLKKSLEKARSGKYLLGVKLVRGAYMEKENKRAREENRSTPIQPDKASCDRDYNAALNLCLDNLEQVSFCAATHNEQSCLMLATEMKKRNIPVNHPHIHISQLYGMSDHISFNMADAGYSVSKYVPYGPVKDVIPYLIRRAQENTAVTGQMSRELTMIKKEMKRRKQGR